MEKDERIPKNSDENDNDKIDEFATEAQNEEDDIEGTKAIEMPEKNEEKSDTEDSTIIEIEGESIDSFEKFAVLALVDIAPDVKRKVPQFFHIHKPKTIIGTHKNAHIKADDCNTVKAEHGVIAFKNGRFYIYPQEGVVTASGKDVPKEGEVLKNGARIEIGSAKFIFLTALEE